MYEFQKINEEDFWARIQNHEGDFSHTDFDFEIDFQNITEINFELNFSKSIFRKKVQFRKTVFKKHFILAKAIFESEVDFFSSTFEAPFSVNSAKFHKNTTFNATHFHSDADFNKTNFFDPVYFKKTRFSKNVSFHKTYFYKKADFSYAHFSQSDLTSFTGINDGLLVDGEKVEPLFIFRNILFHPSTIFNDVDLGRAIFQDSIIEDIVFKECIFPKIDGRNAFYTEMAETKKMEIDSGLVNLSSGEVNTILIDEDDEIADLCLSDRISIKDKESGDKDRFFVVTKFTFNSIEEAEEMFSALNHTRNFIGVRDINVKICLPEDRDCNKKIVALRLKPFVARKHWEVLEDLYRQMKKSLEDSHDWQMAGDFYKGEMNAKMNLLKVRKEQLGYRLTLWFYKTISYFGESASRIFLVVILSGFVGTLILKDFIPTMTWMEAVSTNLNLYMPIFGGSTITIDSLNLRPYQEIIIYAEIVWFYLMWLILAIAVRRRFRR